MKTYTEYYRELNPYCFVMQVRSEAYANDKVTEIQSTGRKAYIEQYSDERGPYFQVWATQFTSKSSN